jgi:DNA-binding response OmpR family regulator
MKKKTTTQNNPGGAGSCQKKILIIEDDVMIIEIYAMRLAEAGYLVYKALDGGQGLEMAEKLKPSLILLDVILPKLDGFAVLKSLKEQETTKNIPVIILTNLGQQDDMQKGIELGAVDYVVKASLTPAQMVAKVAEHLN